ncbi:Carboxymethylenebutenolidase-like [Symbiodinium microadriaticum]|uniref:Carboxymethylenebutenolidase-like n=1 Tax=Symbiodinium microadriaticum TaxID=2951 RepID=A0A1Q9C5J9_SYMMI|nr:Carboxymethylenebutenolidase-like [Symbiodinium microadriaticum]
MDAASISSDSGSSSADEAAPRRRFSFAEKTARKQQMPMLRTAILRAGSSFGEAALDTGLPRQATVRCEEKCWVAVLRRQDFHDVLMNCDTDSHRAWCSFAAAAPVLRELPESVRVRLVAHCRTLQVEKAQRVCQLGEPVHEVVFLVEGNFQVFAQPGGPDTEDIFRRRDISPTKGIRKKEFYNAVSEKGSSRTGLEAYVVGKGNKRAVVVACDLFGIHMGRNKEICDSLADEGFLVVLPDFFKGAYEDVGSDPGFWEMLRQAPTVLTPLNTPWADVEQDLEVSVLPFLEEQGCAENAGVLGFCWGAWVVAHSCARFGFRCGAMAHPSIHTLTLRWGEDEEALLSGINVPQLVLASKDEPATWKPGGRAEKLLKSESSIFKEFPSMSHGFVPRGDLKDSQVASDVARAMEYIKGFLCKHLPRAVATSLLPSPAVFGLSALLRNETHEPYKSPAPCIPFVPSEPTGKFAANVAHSHTSNEVAAMSEPAKLWLRMFAQLRSGCHPLRLSCLAAAVIGSARRC